MRRSKCGCHPLNAGELAGLDYAINVDTLDLCKRGLDKFWDNQIVKFDFEADFHGV